MDTVLTSCDSSQAEMNKQFSSLEQNVLSMEKYVSDK